MKTRENPRSMHLRSFSLGVLFQAAAIACIVLIAVWFRLTGAGRSLWLDEAWVANSVLEKSFGDMFYYDKWLQTSPPLFLILTRLSTWLFGISALTYRIVPLLLSLLSIFLAFSLTRQVVSSYLALPAWSLIVMCPLAVQYSTTLKQYSGELAATLMILWATTRYIRLPNRQNALLLSPLAILGFGLAYSSIFLIPSVIAVILICIPSNDGNRASSSTMTTLIRAATVAIPVGLFAAFVYFTLIVPNTSPALLSYWAGTAPTGNIVLHIRYTIRQLLLDLVPQTNWILASARVGNLLIAGILLVGLGLAVYRWRRGEKRWLIAQLLFGGPLLTVCIASYLRVYPLTGRLSLFILPALVLLFMSQIDLILKTLSVYLPSARAFRVSTAILGIALFALLLNNQRSQLVKAALSTPNEDFASAIKYLKENYSDDDVVWVHASASEPFDFYTRLLRWTPKHVAHGATGWPCCPRQFDARAKSSTPQKVLNDLSRTGVIPPHGRLWMLYTERVEHWRYTGLDEGKVTEEALISGGCGLSRSPDFKNIRLSLFTCPAR